jgi:hypothetical protein
MMDAHGTNIQVDVLSLIWRAPHADEIAVGWGGLATDEVDRECLLQAQAP